MRRLPSLSLALALPAVLASACTVSEGRPPPPVYGPPPAPERVSVHPQGYKGSGMAHPKVCPGMQQTYEQELFDVTPTSFRIEIEYEVADGWDCPNPRPGPMCRTGLSYEYRLVQAACPAHCDAGVPGQRDEQVPAGPVQLSCACP